MVAHRAETQAYLDAVEQSTRRTLRLRGEIAMLIEVAGERGMEPLLEDVLFRAKFISNARNILSRVGKGRDDTEKLSLEFKEQLANVGTLLRTLVKEAPEDWKSAFARKYFSLDQESMASLLVLLEELSWLKNYALDRERSRDAGLQ